MKQKNGFKYFIIDKYFTIEICVDLFEALHMYV